MEVHLDGRQVRTEAAVHDAFRAASGVEWYGGNLDALFDLLVGVVAPPIIIRWTDADLSRQGIGARFDRLICVILDAVAERGGDAIRFTLDSSR